MARRHEMMFAENVESLQIPEDAKSFEGFWRWVDSDEFPESGRIDFLGGEIEADMSPEDLYTHGALKVEMVAVLVELVKWSGLGDVQSDRSRFRSPFARVTTEPDIVAVFRESIESGRARLVPSTRRKGQNRIVAFEGAVDLIVEIVSDSSVGKDLDRLPPFYARAGVRELWLLDARRTEVRFDLLTLQEGAYTIVQCDAEGWLRSPCLGRAFRLRRFHQPPFPWSYRLEHKSPG
jgi:Uma2 family endonuclease